MATVVMRQLSFQSPDVAVMSWGRSLCGISSCHRSACDSVISFVAVSCHAIKMELSPSISVRLSRPCNL